MKRLKKAVTIRLEPDIIDYFKSLTTETGIPYQNLINLYLLDCAKAGRKLSLTWRSEARGEMFTDLFPVLPSSSSVITAMTIPATSTTTPTK